MFTLFIFELVLKNTEECPDEENTIVCISMCLSSSDLYHVCVHVQLHVYSAWLPALLYYYMLVSKPYQ